MLGQKLPLAIAIGVVSAGLFAAPTFALPTLSGNARDLNEQAQQPDPGGHVTTPEKKEPAPKKAEPAPKAAAPKKVEPAPEKKEPAPKKAESNLPAQPRELDRDQIENARIIIGVGKAFRIPDRGIQIALMAAFQESNMYNLSYGDKDSKGLFQQRPSYGWGTEDQVQTRTFATQSFFGVNKAVHNPGLLDIPGWENMSLNDAAQAVQRSGFPDRYGKWEDLAWRTLEANRDAPEISHSGPIL